MMIASYFVAMVRPAGVFSPLPLGERGGSEQSAAAAYLRRRRHFLLDEDLPGVNLLEAEGVEELVGHVVLLVEVDFDDLEVLVLHLPEDVGEEQLAEALAAVVGVDL